MAFWSTMPPSAPSTSRCPDFIAFLGILLEEPESRTRGLHPVLTSSWPDFDDVRMGGASFEVRKVRTRSFPTGLPAHILGGKEFVAVKHPRVERDSIEPGGRLPEHILSDMATELQILRHVGLRQHANIIRLLGMMYHDAGEIGSPCIVPALVMEYAELGNLQTYQEHGYLMSTDDRLDACLDTARGLQALHEIRIIHGDVKASNLLVCKHPTRKFIVKLTDFGYSMPFGGDLNDLGFTNRFKPPETSGSVQKEYLPQVDIFTFGLLVVGVFKNGHAFPSTASDEQAEKYKNIGAMAVLPQMSLLLSATSDTANDNYLPLLVCKVMAYCLQPSPERRFKAIARVVELFEACRPRTVPVGGDMEALVKMLCTMLKDMQDSAKSPVDRFFSSLREITDETWLKFLDRVKIKANERMNLELQKFQPLSELLLQPSHPNTHNLICFLRGYSLLSLDPTKETQAVLSETWGFSTAFMPDLTMPRMAETVGSMPWVVQQAIARDLGVIATSDLDSSRKASAKINQASAYLCGLGVDPNVQMAADLVLEAAKDGDTRARGLYAAVFCSTSKPSTTMDLETRRTWLTRAAEDGDSLSLHHLRLQWPDDWRRVRTKRAHAEVEPLGEAARDRLKFRRAVLQEDVDGVDAMLDSKPNLLLEDLGDGETALLLSTRFGLALVTRALLERGADPTLRDLAGVTPLHWLISFHPDDQPEMASLLVRKGADPHATTSAFPSRGGHPHHAPERGEPLHWAIVNQDLSAIDALLSIGASVTFHEPSPGELPALAPWEFACRIADAQIMAYLLAIDGVAAKVARPQPLRDMPGMAYPLFWLTAGCTLQDRVMRYGGAYEKGMREAMRLLAGLEGYDATALRLPGTNQWMTGVFSAVIHRNSADVLRAGIEEGHFSVGLDMPWGMASGSTALFLSIAHRDMFEYLLSAGADVHARDQHGLSTLHRAAKETDDIFFAEKLLEAGVPLEPSDHTIVSPFYVAVFCGNYTIARYLYDRGADRDRFTRRNENVQTTILGDMLRKHTHSSAQRVEFLLGLPDRGGSDGFIVMRIEPGKPTEEFSAFHVIGPEMTEDPDDAEITRVLIELLLEKYHSPAHLNKTGPPYEQTVVDQSTEIGNYKVVAALLQRGADANLADAYGRTPLDKLHFRYCYPALTPALKGADLGDPRRIARTVAYVNRNTSELYGLLQSHGAAPGIFRWPGWHAERPGYRDAKWVIDRLREDQSPEKMARKQVTRESATKAAKQAAEGSGRVELIWGGLPIRSRGGTRSTEPKDMPSGGERESSII